MRCGMSVTGASERSSFSDDSSLRMRSTFSCVWVRRLRIITGHIFECFFRNNRAIVLAMLPPTASASFFFMRSHDRGSFPVFNERELAVQLFPFKDEFQITLI